MIAGLGMLAVVGGAWLLASRVTFVDSREAKTVATAFFASLERSESREVMTFFSPEFREQGEAVWSNFLIDTESKTGPVEKVRLIDETIIPNGEVGCVGLRYEVDRKTMATEERLTLCPGQPGGPWQIIGHQLIRKDNGKQIGAGQTFGRTDLLGP